MAWTCAAAPARASGCSRRCAGDGSRASISARACWRRRAPRIRRLRGCGLTPAPIPFAADFDLAVSFGALGHFLPAERPAVFAGVYRALRPGGLFAFPTGVRPSPASVWYWAALGFDVVMRVRNAVWRPPFVMYYRANPLPAVREDLVRAGFTVDVVDLAVRVPRSSGPRYRLILARKPPGA